jgi:hypothetical protein
MGLGSLVIDLLISLGLVFATIQDKVTLREAGYIWNI